MIGEQCGTARVITVQVFIQCDTHEHRALRVSHDSAREIEDVSQPVRTAGSDEQHEIPLRVEGCELRLVCVVASQRPLDRFHIEPRADTLRPFGAATIVFGLSQNFWLSLAMLVLIGASDNISVIIRQTLVQSLTPDAMRGRVSAVNQVFIGASNELGGLESGVTAKLFGPVLSVVAGGLGTLLVVAGVAGIWPQIRQLGSLREPGE